MISPAIKIAGVGAVTAGVTAGWYKAFDAAHDHGHRVGHNDRRNILHGIAVPTHAATAIAGGELIKSGRAPYLGAALLGVTAAYALGAFAHALPHDLEEAWNAA